MLPNSKATAMKWLLCLFALLLNPSITVGDAIRNAVDLNVVDEQGSQVDQFEVMYHATDESYGQWQSAADGKASLALLNPKASAYEVFVRADGFASTSVIFEGDTLEELLQGQATIVLERGQEVQLQLAVPEDLVVPENLLAKLSFNGHPFGANYLNMLNVKPIGKGIYKLRLASKPRKFHVVIHHPGWLQFCALGQFSNEDFTDEGTLQVEVPYPASVEASLNCGELTDSQLDFDQVNYKLMWQLPGTDNRYIQVATADRPVGEKFSLSDLGPGSYYLRLQTSPREVSEADEELEIDPGEYKDRRKFEIVSNQAKKLDIEFVPFNEEAFRGDGTARIKVLGPDGLPAKQRTIKVTYYDGHYGRLTVHEGTIPKDGITVLEGISQESGSAFGPYTVEVDDERLGFFSFDDGQATQDFGFRLIPKQGDLAPDISMVNVKTGQTTQLSEMKGKIVLLEFWATWCGPCQPAMKELNELERSHREIWNDKVAIVPLSVDDSSERVMHHVDQRGWAGLNHFLSARVESGSPSPAEQAYVVRGIPTTLLIDRSGRIAWRRRGYHVNDKDGYDMTERIERLLSGKNIEPTEP